MSLFIEWPSCCVVCVCVCVCMCIYQQTLNLHILNLRLSLKADSKFSTFFQGVKRSGKFLATQICITIYISCHSFCYCQIAINPFSYH